MFLLTFRWIEVEKFSEEQKNQNFVRYLLITFYNISMEIKIELANLSQGSNFDNFIKCFFDV